MNKKVSFALGAVFVVIILIAAGIFIIKGGGTPGGDQEEEIHVAQWTTFMWMCGDGNLADWNMMLCNIHYLEMVPDDEDVNVIIMLDRDEDGDTKVLELHEGGSTVINITEINPEWADHELNLGDPEPFIEFLKWGVDNYPAYKYNIHPVNHGGGWRGMCWDESSGDHLSLPELRYVCEEFVAYTNRSVDIFSTEGCQVGMLEFAYELRNTCDFFVAGSTYGWGAEAEPENDKWEPGNWQYDTCWGALSANPNMTGEEFATVMSETFMPYGPWRAPPFMPKEGHSDVFATFNLSKVEELAQAVDMLAGELKSACSGVGQTVNQGILINSVLGHPELPDEMYTEYFSAQMDWAGVSVYTNFDLYDFAYMLTKNSAVTLKSSNAQAVMDLIEEVIMIYRCVDEPGGHPDAHGISIYIPYRSSEYNPAYEEIQFAQDTQWDEFIKSVHWA